MRKQTKIVAVASAAALLAIGASMTAFAAQGWVEEDGTWYYYDRDENRVTDEWKRSGDNWYWLDGEEDGAMAVDKLVEDGDDTYYVDANGVMVRNTWVRIVNEDQDDDTDPAEYRYYYMQSNGKAYKNTNTNDGLTKKTIDGKRYAFDDEGKMLYGWVTKDGTLANGEEEWENAMYYFGGWDDGAMKTSWQKIYVHDEDKGDDYDYWFCFKANGHKRTGNKTEDDPDTYDASSTYNYNGFKYHFDERGVMTYQWVVTSGSNTSSVSNWSYFRTPEEGARVTKGWFKVVPPSEDNSFNESDASFAETDSLEENERWYYADVNGHLYEGKIVSIKGKYYGFAPEDDAKSTDTKGGHMLTGLCLLQMKGDVIEAVIKEDMDSDYLDGLIEDGDTTLTEEGQYLYYFGNDADHDGAMKTGNVTINLDGSTYNFFFKKTSNAAGGRGQGVNGIDDNKYIYMNGYRVKADSDVKYQLVKVAASDNGSTNINAEGVFVTKAAPVKLDIELAPNKDDEIVRCAKIPAGYYLVNTSGNIQKNKSGAKDGNDCYYYVGDKTHNYQVLYYTDNKNLTSKKDYDGLNQKVSGNSWKDLYAALGTASAE